MSFHRSSWSSPNQFTLIATWAFAILVVPASLCGQTEGPRRRISPALRVVLCGQGILPCGFQSAGRCFPARPLAVIRRFISRLDA